MEKTALSVALGRNLKNIRLLRGLSAENIADMIGITLDSVYKYERGERDMTIAFKYRAAEAIGCNPQEFEDGLDRLGTRGQPIRKPMRVTSQVTHDNLRWMASEWDGDVDALVTFAAMVARWPKDQRRELYMQANIQNDRLIAEGIIDPADQPAGMDEMRQANGALYAEGDV